MVDLQVARGNDCMKKGLLWNHYDPIFYWSAVHMKCFLYFMPASEIDLGKQQYMQRAVRDDRPQIFS